MAQYVLPTFNVPINIWHDGTPTTDPPDDTAIVNFAWDRRSHSDGIDPAAQESNTPFMTVLAPSGTDLRGYVNTGGTPDTIEVPADSGRFYTVHYVDYIGLMFPNEHMGADVWMIAGMGPPLVFAILTEGDDPILTEGGDILVPE